jgi:Tannase and feruloyl esterase
MEIFRPPRRSARRTRPWRAGGIAVLAAVLALAVAAFAAVPAIGHTTTKAKPAVVKTVTRTATATTSSAGAQAGLKNLPDKKAKETCASLVSEANSQKVNGLKVDITESQVGSYAAGDPEYCAVTGHIATNIGFEVMLPMTTWHERYLQLGCGGLCGNIGLNAPQSSSFKALADGYFVVAGQDEGHDGSGTSWSTNSSQRVDFAYLSDHDLAQVSKGLADMFYGIGPKYSYFDGCSQGGHQALAEAQRYPKDFNGILAGAPATIMTELNSVLHEYEFNTVNNSDGSPILSEVQADLLYNTALKECGDTKVGVILDNFACQNKLKLNSVLCKADQSGDSSSCLTADQIRAIDRIMYGPATTNGTKLYPGGYSLSSAWDWDNGTGPNVPATMTETTTPGAFITAWLQYFAFEKNIGQVGLDNELYTKAYFKKITKLAPFWDDTDPYLQPFEKAGGKLILWQGEGDWSIPTDSSLAYYQHVVTAAGGLKAAEKFSRYYLLPSTGHCGQGVGAGDLANSSDENESFSGLEGVVKWAETGSAPKRLTASDYETAPSTGGGPGGPGGPGGGTSTSDLTDAIASLGGAPAGTDIQSISIFPYPELPVYNGTGNVDQASSYSGKVSKAVEEPLKSAVTFDRKMIWCNAKGVDCKTREMPK